MRRKKTKLIIDFIESLTSDETCTLASGNLFFLIDWLVGCFGFNGPLRQYFSLYRAVFQREGDRGEKG